MCRSDYDWIQTTRSVHRYNLMHKIYCVICMLIPIIFLDYWGIIQTVGFLHGIHATLPKIFAITTISSIFLSLSQLLWCASFQFYSLQSLDSWFCPIRFVLLYLAPFFAAGSVFIMATISNNSTLIKPRAVL